MLVFESMIRFFSINDPYRLLFVLVFMAGLGWFADRQMTLQTVPEQKGIMVGQMMAEGKSLYTEVWDSTPPVTAFLHRIAFTIAGDSLAFRHIITMAVFFLQVAFFGVLLIQNRAFDQSGYLPSFLFAVLLFYTFDSMAFTREVWASSFLLLALGRVLRQIQFRNQMLSNLNVLGILIGLASLCSFSYIIFFPGVLMILIVNTRLEPKMVFLYILGFLFPHLLIGTIWFLNGNLSYLLQFYYLENSAFNTQTYFSLISFVVITALPVSYLLFGLIKGRGGLSTTRYQSQIWVVMAFWIVLGLLEVWLARQRSPQALVPLIPPTAYFLHYYFIRVKRNWLANLMVWLLILGVPAIGYYGMKGSLPEVSYDSVFIHESKNTHAGKKVLVLADEYELYEGGDVGGFFPEWALSEDLFRNPRFYENVIVLKRAFTANPPDVIVDPENLMSGVFELLPDVAGRYQRNEKGYVRTSKDD